MTAEASPSSSTPPSRNTPNILPPLKLCPLRNFLFMNAVTGGQTSGGCIRANPDVSGAGIRTSIYVQALLNPFFALILAFNATILHSEHSPLALSSRSLCITGWTLLICAFYQSTIQGLTVHHTLIVLNLSWIIYLSTLLSVLIRTCQVVPQSHENHPAIPLRRPTLESSQVHSIGPRTEPAANVRTAWRLMIPPASHLSALGFLGILLWTQVDTFGDQPECTSLTALTIFGSSYSVLDVTTRRGSMAIYWLLAVPLLNVLLTCAAISIAPAGIALVLWTAERVTRRRFLPWAVFACWSGIATISVLLVLFISNTELMIARGLHTSLVKAGEEEWTLGQLYSLVTLLVHMAEMFKVLSSWRVDWGGGRRR